MPHSPEDLPTPVAVPRGAAGRVEIRPLAPGVVLAQVSGDLDYLVTPSVRRHLFEQLGRCDCLVVDLSAVTLLSGAALDMLVDVDALASPSGTEIRIVAATRPVCRPLRLTGLDRSLRVHSSVASAIRPPDCG
jgi:anti-anti-sigma factor